MSGDLEERMGQLCDELQQALDAGQSVDTGELAERFAIPQPDVLKALQALRAMHDVLGEDAVAQQHDLAPPRLSDDYEVLDELGRGGMGVVYRAHQKSLDRDLAVKVLRPGDLLFGDAIRRFEREAKSLARLRHRHIVSVHEVGKADGFVYFTMDLIDGCTLAERLENGAMPTTQAVKLLLQVCSAMAYAHGKGVMHRDVKPGNVLLDASGDAFVCDFGLARELGGEHGATLTGQMLGTPAYMSPEQALGDQDRIGEQTDVYALGAILYECLAGKAPFAGLPLAQLMHAVVASEPVPLRKRNARVPLDLQVIVDKAMRKDPTERYATVQALAEDLERFSIGKEILARPTSSLEQGWRALRRNRRGIARTMVPVALLLTLAWLFVLPSVMRDRTLALAERLRASGSPQGEVAAYEELYDRTSPDSIPERDRVRYLRACYDEATRLWLHGSDTEQERANHLLARAIELLGKLDRTDHLRWTADMDPSIRDAFRIQHTRMQPLLPDGPRQMRMLGQAEVQAALLVSREAAASASNHILAAGSIAPVGWSDAAWTAQQRAAVLDLLPTCARLPQPLREHLEYACRSALTIPLEYDDMPFLARLVEIAADPTLHREARENAAALFHVAGWLPFLTQSRLDQRRGQAHLLAAGDRDLEWLQATWGRLQHLPKLGQYRARVEAVAERYVQATRLGTLGRYARDDLEQWLREHTGLPRVDADTVEAVQRRSGESDPRDRLLQSMSWHVQADDLSVDELLERLDGRHAAQAHHLLELTVADGIRVPERRPRTQWRTKPRWLQALQRTSRYDRRLRVVTFEIPDGEFEPRILDRQQLVVRLDQPVDWRAPVAGRLSFPSAFLGERGRRGIFLSQTREPRGTASLRLNGTRLKLRFAQVGSGSTPLGVWPSYYDGDRDSDAGIVTFVAGACWHSAARSASYTWCTLAVTEPVEAANTPWDLEQWRAVLAGSVRSMSTDQPLAINNAKHLAAASFLAAPVEPATWAMLNQQFDGLHEDYCLLHRCAARLMSGDESAIEGDTSPIGDGHGNEFLDAAFYVRLALSTRSEAIRAHAFERLQHARLTPDLIRTLANHRRRLGTVSAELAADLDSASTPLGALLRTMTAGLVLLFAHLGLLTWSVIRMFGTGARRRLAALAAIALALLWNRWAICFDGVGLNPIWLGHALATLAVWTLCWRATYGPGWLLVALLWTGTSAAHATGHLDHPVPAWTATAIALLSLPMHRDFIRRAPQPASAS